MPGVVVSELLNIWISSSEGDKEAVEQYIRAGNDPNAKDENGYTPIHATASYGHIELLEFLLQNGGDANITDNDGDTPLHFSETAAAVQCLLKYGADPAKRNAEGVLPIETADEDERSEVVEVLKELTPDYRKAERQDEGEDLMHVRQAEDGEAVLSVNLGRLQEMAQSGALETLINSMGGSEEMEDES
ncbi:hypothetical protein HDU97_008748 [Phlyctochytrium planicorne]|nr:hypothetical protein HDU97_008748 [Phlyctochytrium planicorne]